MMQLTASLTSKTLVRLMLFKHLLPSMWNDQYMKISRFSSLYIKVNTLPVCTPINCKQLGIKIATVGQIKEHIRHNFVSDNRQ